MTVVYNKSFSQFIRYCLFVVLFTSLLSACGGGGGSGNSNNTDTGGDRNNNNTNTGGNNNPPGNSDDSLEPINIRSNVASYYDALELLQMDVPAGWETFEFADSPEILVAMADLDTSTLQTGFMFILKVNALNDVDVSDDGEINVISQRNVTLNGLDALEEIGDALIDSENFRIISTALQYNSRVYAVIYANLNNNFNTYLAKYNEALASFKIGEKLLTNLEDFADYQNPGKAGVASDGNNFLFVSCRSSAAPPFQYNLVGRLIRDDRTVMPEFVIHSNIKFQNGIGGPKCVHASPHVVFDGTNFLVTYTSDLGSITVINGKRISPAGTILDPTPINISQNTTGHTYQSAVVFDGTNTFVTWYEESFAGGGKHIMGAFVEPDMDLSARVAISDNLDIDYPNTTFDMFIPQVAYGNNRLLTIWGPYLTRRHHFTSDDYTIYGQVLGLDGIRQTPNRFAIRTDPGTRPRYPQVASDGNEFVVGWIEGAFIDSMAENGSYKIQARRVSTNSALLNGAANTLGTLIAPVSTVLNNEVPKDFLDLTYRNGKYLFLWSATNPIAVRGIYGVSATNSLGSISNPQRVVGALESVDYDLAVVAEVPTHSSIAYSNDTALLVWPSWRKQVEGWFFQGAVVD